MKKAKQTGEIIMTTKKKTVQKAVKRTPAKKTATKKATPKKPTAKKAVKKPEAKKVVAKPPTKTETKKPVKKADKPLARNEIYVRGDGIQMKIYKRIPKGWKITEGATAAPKGYKIIDNKKSLFAKNEKDRREYGLIESEQHKSMTKKEKDKWHGSKPITIIKRSGRKITYGAVKKAGKTK